MRTGNTIELVLEMEHSIAALYWYPVLPGGWMAEAPRPGYRPCDHEAPDEENYAIVSDSGYHLLITNTTCVVVWLMFMYDSIRLHCSWG